MSTAVTGCQPRSRSRMASRERPAPTSTAGPGGPAKSAISSSDVVGSPSNQLTSSGAFAS